ncbi:hypothetical protein PPERSA_10422 [Pseudocohnilembus persalinus]|uniref:Uncharacterized protein n=1 Tax=Pseudocohnilembus persalinus TaxID=266149 RepID=A0A0V0QWJ6_PSEPJ|nr:hypothetical protein PPERSA_10422 [Pseudocohnilembus persalinus]|eukprot:KRX06564.1 hypothetical protein PPERSA_10422 [Pseudocohnilembus persalinus]
MDRQEDSELENTFEFNRDTSDENKRYSNFMIVIKIQENQVKTLIDKMYVAFKIKEKYSQFKYIYEENGQKLIIFLNVMKNVKTIKVVKDLIGTEIQEVLPFKNNFISQQTNNFFDKYKYQHVLNNPNQIISDKITQVVNNYYQVRTNKILLFSELIEKFTNELKDLALNNQQ